MKLITREELLNIKEMVAYSEYEKGEFGEYVQIKYPSSGSVSINNWTVEDFPVLKPDLGELSNGTYYDDVEIFESMPIGIEHKLSDFETSGEGSYDELGTLYILYSKEDIKGWIAKLNELL